MLAALRRQIEIHFKKDAPFCRRRDHFLFFETIKNSFLFGACHFFVGVAYALYAILKYFNGKTIPGWTSLLVTVLILGGIQLLSLGIIGEYLARIFNESKARPLYFIKDKVN